MGQAHIWGWPGQYMVPAEAQHGPGPWAGPMRPCPALARTYLGKNIFQKQYPEKHEYIIYHDMLTFVDFSKKDARQKMMKIAAICAPRSLI